MTKSTITRERLQEIAEDGFLKHGESKELARIALAAMDSESGCLPLDYLQGHKDGLEWAAQLAEANHPETVDWLYDDPIELAKAIRKGPDMPPAQPAPVVPDDLLSMAASAIEDLLEHTDPNTSYYSGVWADMPGKLRAAMLQAEPVTTANKLENTPVNGVTSGKPFTNGDVVTTKSRCTIQTAPTLDSSQKNAESRCGNSPVIPDTWIPVSERMPIPGVDVLVAKEFFGPGDWRRKVGHVRHEDSGWYIYGASWTPTHWMPMPAAPQEVRKSNVIGTYQGADGKDHPIINLSGPLQEVGDA